MKPTISVQIINDVLAGFLKQLFPGVSVYVNPNQQGTKTPSFFIQYMPHSGIRKQVAERYNRKLFIDLIYMDDYNLTDLYDRYLKVVETLDENIELLPITQNGTLYYLRTYERDWSVELSELHYKFYLEFRASISRADDEQMLSIERLNLNLKE